MHKFNSSKNNKIYVNLAGNNKYRSSAVASTTSATSSRTGCSYWQGPPAHFMLPTHAIHCRSSQSIERCPRACKGNPIIFLTVLATFLAHFL